METTVVVVAVIFLGLISLLASLRTFIVSSAVVLGLLFFGPVVYRIAVLGQEGLVWELAFRAALVLIAAYAAKELIKLDDSITNKP